MFRMSSRRRTQRARVLKWTIAGVSVMAITAGGYFFNAYASNTTHQNTTASATTVSSNTHKKKTTIAANIYTVSDPAQTLPPNTPVGQNFNWKAPTGGSYPALSHYKDVWIDVSLSTQRIHIMSANQTIYTMITSSGLDGPNTYTPTGTYYVQPERGTWFYTPRFQEGAEYWVSWKGHGQYLFHSVPMNKQHQVIKSAAADLGVKASHGCFHLTISDAKWIYENIPTGTKVVIHK